MTEFWWAFGVGTIAFLALSVGLIVGVIRFHRTRMRLERDKYESLLASERKFSDLFNNVSDVVYIHSLDGRILEINRSAEDLTGYRRDELIGKPISALVYGFHKRRFGEYLALLSGTAGVANGIVPLMHRDRRRFIILEYRSSLMSDENSPVAVRGIARHVTDQVMNARRLRRSEQKASALLHRSQEMQKNLQLLSRKILQMNEDDRKTISRELHDEVGQLLTGLSMNLEVVRKSLPETQSETRHKIIDSQNLTSRVLDQIHRFLVELRPAVLDELGLLPAIRNLASTFQDRSGIRVTVTGDPSIEQLGNDQKIVLYRVVQESLTNAFKHSQAQLVDIELLRSNDHVTLEIKDNGVGFETTCDNDGSGSTRRRLGILGMEERVKLIDGTIDIISRTKEGTRLSIRIPLTMNGGEHGQDQDSSRG